MKVAFLGATQGMGRALARLMAERGDALFLLGRDPADLERSARDLEARGGQRRASGTAACDLERPETFAPALDAAEAALGGLDAVVVTAGPLRHPGRLEADPELARRAAAPSTSPTPWLFCEEARKRLLARGGGTLCVFSSVAGERGRKPVVLYGAAKAGLTPLPRGPRPPFRAAGPAHGVREARASCRPR